MSTIPPNKEDDDDFYDSKKKGIIKRMNEERPYLGLKQTKLNLKRKSPNLTSGVNPLKKVDL